MYTQTQTKERAGCGVRGTGDTSMGPGGGPTVRVAAAMAAESPARDSAPGASNRKRMAWMQTCQESNAAKVRFRIYGREMKRSMRYDRLGFVIRNAQKSLREAVDLHC